MARQISFLVGLMLLCGGVLFATAVATVRGIVHDSQHRPIADAEVVLKAEHSEFTQTSRTSAEGEFHFDSVPIGEYRITVTKTDFGAQQERLTVLSGTAPILHIELKVAKQAQSVTVTSEAPPAQTESITPTTLVTREEITETPGASRTNSLAMITDYVPGAYYTHDQLHVRGGHQVSWLIDGVSIPNTNIASNLGPQIDPKDIDTLEVQRGSYSADYGDRTYGIFNVAPRTGFERNNEAELVVTAGNFYQTDDQLNFGGHTNRFAYYASVAGNRTDLGLQTPTSAVIHDQANGYGGFASLTYNLNSADQFRLVTQLRRDYYQVPFDPNNPSNAPGAYLKDFNRENDAYVLFSWVHSFNPGLVLNVSPYYHHNSVNYGSSPQDFPSAATQNQDSSYAGGQAVLSWVAKRNSLRSGITGFGQSANEFFRLVYTDGSFPTITDRANIGGGLAAVFVEDQLKATSWLTLNAGVRQTHFSGGVVENATDPRVGASLRVPKLNWVFRAFYGHFYQAPPLVTISGPALAQIMDLQQLSYIPLRGERDEEHQYGVTIPLWRWTIDADNFLTRARNFFDHNNLNNSNVFFPVTIQGARINAWELTLRSPNFHKRAQMYLTYSNQLALSIGCVTGGLIGSCPTPPPGYHFLDHDQRNTLHIGGNVNLPWRTYASTDVYYGSGFSNGDPTLPGDHLQPHTTFDMTLGKDFGERVSLSVTGLNVGNRRVLLDNSFTFGGTHWNNPREIFAQVRYRFHY
jgi:outer membrane receptor protein involved in Fe transport